MISNNLMHTFTYLTQHIDKLHFKLNRTENKRHKTTIYCSSGWIIHSRACWLAGWLVGRLFACLFLPPCLCCSFILCTIHQRSTDSIYPVLQPYIYDTIGLRWYDDDDDTETDTTATGTDAVGCWLLAAALSIQPLEYCNMPFTFLLHFICFGWTCLNVVHWWISLSELYCNLLSWTHWSPNKNLSNCI